MNSLKARNRRLSKPTLESLDDRIVPSAAGTGLQAQAVEARATHVAEVRAARAEHQAEVREARLQRVEARAEHRAEVRAERLQMQQAQQAARFARLHRPAPNPTVASSFSAAYTPTTTNTTSTSSASTSSQAVSIVPASSTSTASSSSSTPNMVPVAPMPASSSDSGNTAPTSSSTNSSATAAAATTGSGDVSDVKNGPLAKAGQNLIAVYTQYESAGGGTDFTLTGGLANLIRIQGDSVGVDVGTSPANVESLSSTLTALGMQITATDPSHGLIEGYLPIAQLPTVSQNSDVVTLAPNYRPSMPPPAGSGGGFTPR